MSSFKFEVQSLNTTFVFFDSFNESGYQKHIEKNHICLKQMATTLQHLSFDVIEKLLDNFQQHPSQEKLKNYILNPVANYTISKFQRYFYGIVTIMLINTILLIVIIIVIAKHIINK